MKVLKLREGDSGYNEGVDENVNSEVEAKDLFIESDFEYEWEWQLIWSICR